MTEVVQGGSAANTYLVMAAAARQRVAVVTDHGVQTGYLLGIDEDDIVLWGPMGADESTVNTVFILPRTLTIFLQNHTLDREPKDMAETYSAMAHGFLSACEAQAIELTKGKS